MLTVRLGLWKLTLSSRSEFQKERLMRSVTEEFPFFSRVMFPTV